jgi:Clostripain family
MMYQMADNNLEFYIRQDYDELIDSQVIKDPDLRTWVYFDALNQGGSALPNTVDSNGVQVTDFTGSRYMTYDAGLGKMRVVEELPGEQNSDKPEVISSFLQRAIGDCVENGFDSLMAVFSSHGGGFAGFGGDENVRRLRKLLTTNNAIAGAVQTALQAVPGAPDKLDVIGFDACLMESLGAIDDYMGIAKYMLGSEAVEPGHGEPNNYCNIKRRCWKQKRQANAISFPCVQVGHMHS